MEGIKLALGVIDKYGIMGFLVLVLGLVAITSSIREILFLWKKFISKTHVSEKDIQAQLDSLNRVRDLNLGRIVQLETRMHKVDEHLDQEQEEIAMFSQLRSDIDHMKDKVETENSHVFAQLKSLHEKFDTLTRIMLEQKKA